jgi:HEAT repeat protein
MRYWLPFLFMAACGDDSDFSKEDVDKAFVAKDYERACRGVRSSDDAVRSHAASRLSTVSDTVASECICDAMDDGAGGWDPAVLQGLAESKSEALGSCFAELVAKPDLKNRGAAVEALSTLRSKAASETLSELLGDDSLDAMARAGIIENLPRRPDDAALLIEIMKDGGDTSLQAAAATKLAVDAYPEDEVIPALLEASDSKEIEVRLAAISSLRARKADEAGNAVNKAVNDKDEAVRAAIFYLLAGSQDEFEVGELIRSAETEHQSPETRDALLHALVETSCIGRRTEATIRACKGGNDDAKTVLCEAIPYWIKTYVQTPTVDKNGGLRPPKGTAIIEAQNEADPDLTVSCLEDIIRNKTAGMTCFGEYFIKYWYAANLLQDPRLTSNQNETEVDLDKEVRFNFLLDSNYSYQIKDCQ